MRARDAIPDPTTGRLERDAWVSVEVSLHRMRTHFVPFRSVVGIGRPRRDATNRFPLRNQDAKFTTIEPERWRGVRFARVTRDAKESEKAFRSWRYVEGERMFARIVYGGVRDDVGVD